MLIWFHAGYCKKPLRVSEWLKGESFYFYKAQVLLLFAQFFSPSQKCMWKWNNDNFLLNVLIGHNRSEHTRTKDVLFPWQVTNSKICCWIFTITKPEKSASFCKHTIKQSCPGKHLLNDWRHSWCMYDAFAGVRMTLLPVFWQTFGYPSLLCVHFK